jgi:hypothetical protein
LLTAWRAPRTNNQLDHIREIVGAVCDIEVDPDGIEFDRASIDVSRIREGAEYEGVRVRFHGTLARARISMQLDIGFGDVITPGPMEIEYPVWLNFPAPVLQAYPKETVIAEKLEALTALGILNSRLNDYYDLALLSRMYPFKGNRLAEAIVATFRRRGTAIELEPIGLTRAYCDDPARTLQWRAFVRRSRLAEDAGDLTRLVEEIRPFVLPILPSAAAEREFGSRWKPDPGNESCSWLRKAIRTTAPLPPLCRSVSDESGSPGRIHC